jgi:hypothetical protein
MKNNFLSFATLCFLILLKQVAFSQTKTIGLTKHFSGGNEDGYILFTPLSSDTTFLINKCGQRIHEWYSQYTPGLSVYLLPNGHLLKTGTYDDTTFGGAGGRGGIIEELDWDSKLIWSYVIFNDSLCQHHDIRPMPNGNIMVMSWHSISRIAAIALGRSPVNFNNNQTDLWGERLIELKPKGKDSADIVWQWDLFDHLVQDIDSTLPNYGNVSTSEGRMDINYALNLRTHDWIHMNGIDYNSKLDQIIMSCHNISEIWIVDHSTTKTQAKAHTGGKYGKGGDFLYRWGNPAAYKQGGTSNRKLFRQHNATWIPGGFKDSGSIMLFNNGWERDTAYSSVDIIKTPINGNGTYNNLLPFGPSSAYWIYKDSVPKNFYSQIISGAQPLPNGNILICSGVQGRFFEVTPNKKTVWEYKNPTNGFNIQQDGQTPVSNSVFRCVFYPNNYSAFKNKNLTPKGNIELNSYIYSCIYEKTPPKIKTLLPAKNGQTVNLINPIKVIFDEAVLAKAGSLTVYQNNLQFQYFNIPDNNIKINKDTVTILHNAFQNNSRLSIKIANKSFRDSSDNLSAALDSSQWYFYTSKTQPTFAQLIPISQSENNALNAELKIIFKDKVFKNTSGAIDLWENGLFKERIQIASSSIQINSKIVTIQPTLLFAPNATIVVEVAACFIDSNGIQNFPIIFGDWYFKTITTPKIVLLKPLNNSKNTITYPTISITFDRKINLAQAGNLMVYENKVLIDSIVVNGPRATITSNTITFDLNKPFKNSANIAISLQPNTLKDSLNTMSTAIDSSAWHFTTETKSVGSNPEIHFSNSSINIWQSSGKNNFQVSSSVVLNSIDVFDISGKKISINITKGTNERELYFDLPYASAGHYVAFINGIYSKLITIE